MRNLLLLFPITLFSFQPIFAQSNIGTMTVYENGTSKTVQYDNTYPQCFTYSVFITRTISHYKSAYLVRMSLKKADENVSRTALNSIQTVIDKDLPLPFSYQSLMKEASLIKSQIFSKKEVSERFMDIHKECSESLSKNPLMNNSNYDKAIDYSKGEDKIPSK